MDFSLMLACYTGGAVTVTPNPWTGFKCMRTVTRTASLLSPGLPGLPCGNASGFPSFQEPGLELWTVSCSSLLCLSVFHTFHCLANLFLDSQSSTFSLFRIYSPLLPWLFSCTVTKEETSKLPFYPGSSGLSQTPGLKQYSCQNFESSWD
jgi:hypothetical protein